MHAGQQHRNTHRSEPGSGLPKSVQSVSYPVILAFHRRACNHAQRVKCGLCAIAVRIDDKRVATR